MKTYLAIDIGGTAFKYGLVTQTGKLSQKDNVPAVITNRADFNNEMHQLIHKFNQKIDGVAISVPGKVDQATQRIAFGGSLPFLDGYSFAEELNLNVPVAVENDAKAAALAEMWQGSLMAVENGVMLVLGTAVGGGVVLNHQLYYGNHAQAGEVSFMGAGSLKQSDLLGGQASAVGLINRIATQYRLVNQNDGLAVFKLINQNQDFAVHEFQHYCQTIALMIHNIQTILDVDRYVIGGGISQQPILVKGIQTAFNQLRVSNDFVDATLTRPEIVRAQFQNDANLLGAVYRLTLQSQSESAEELIK